MTRSKLSSIKGPPGNAVKGPRLRTQANDEAQSPRHGVPCRVVTFTFCQCGKNGYSGHSDSGSNTNRPPLRTKAGSQGSVALATTRVASASVSARPYPSKANHSRIPGSEDQARM